MSEAFQSHDCSLRKGLRDISEPKYVIFLWIVLFLGTAVPQGAPQAPAHPWHHTKPPSLLPFSRARDAQESWRQRGLTAGKGHQVKSIPVISRASQRTGKRWAELSKWSRAKHCRPQDVSEQRPRGAQSCHCCSEELGGGWPKNRGIYCDKPPGVSQPCGMSSHLIHENLSFSEKSLSESCSLFPARWGGEEHQTPPGISELQRIKFLWWFPPCEHFQDDACSAQTHSMGLILASSSKRDVCVMVGF